MPRPPKKPPAMPSEKDRALALFGESLRELMDDREHTPKEFAARLGVSYDTVVKYRNGKRDPEIYQLLAIAELLNVSLDRLVKGKSGRRTHLRVVPPPET